MKTFISNGKLLLTSEYVVLDGAEALALPTKFGQSLNVEANNSNTIAWKSFNELDEIWYEDTISLNEIAASKRKNQDRNDISERLIQILNAAKSLNSEFLNSDQGYNISTRQDFNRLWGLGTSSTLINNIATWANVDAYALLEKTFGGSGYDIACAQHNTPITYQIANSNLRLVEPVDFNPTFKDQLYFVYLNQKQNSRDGISSYKKTAKINTSIIDEVSGITESILHCKSLSEFETLLYTHETIISKLIKQKPIKERLFKDFNGSIKSLGAWGGDFVLVTSQTNPKHYFNSRGFNVVIPYESMVL